MWKSEKASNALEAHWLAHLEASEQKGEDMEIILCVQFLGVCFVCWLAKVLND